MTSSHFCVCLFLFPCVFCFLFYFVVSLSWYVVPTSRVFTSCRGDCVPQFLMCFTCGQSPLPSLASIYPSVFPFVFVGSSWFSNGFYAVLSWTQPRVFKILWFTLPRQHPRTEPPCSPVRPGPARTLHLLPPLSIYVLFVPGKRLRSSLNTFIYIPLYPGSISRYQNLTPSKQV